jgi:hypothetical protein
MRFMLTAIVFCLCGCATGVVADINAATVDDADAAADDAGCASPETPASCTACSPGKSCQPNGCYSGYVCDTLTNHCKAPTACP